jgi:hypothetical protein
VSATPSPPRRPPYRHPAAIGTLVLVVGVSAFVGYGAWTRRGDIHPSRGGQAFLTSPQIARQAGPAAAPVAQAPKAAQAPAPADVAAAVAAGRPGAVAATPGVAGADAGRSPSRRPATLLPSPAPSPAPTGASIASRPAERPAAPAKTAPAQVRGLPAPGGYGLTVAGSENVKFGPFSFCGRDFPAASTLVVAPADGEPAGSYNFDVRLFPDSAGQHDERHIYRYGADGVTQNFESATVTCSGVRQSSEVSYSPVQPRVRFPLKIGAEWTGSGGDAQRTETYRTKVTGTDVLTLAGRKIPVFVVETNSEFTGSEKGTRLQRWWYSPAYAMPLRWSDRTQGSRTGATYTNDVTITVTSLPAAVTP